MKIGWISAAAYATTGYGNQTRHILARLIDKGFDVINIGGTGTRTVWGGKLQYAVDIGHEVKIPVVPTIEDTSGQSVVNLYIDRYKLDFLVTLWDCFAIDYTTRLQVPVINYLPIDTFFTRTMYDMVAKSNKIVAMSKFGYYELLKFFAPEKVTYIPHGIDVDKYCPLSDKDKAVLKETMGLPRDCFLFLAVCANIGERKQIPFMLQAFKEFSKNHFDAYLYIFTNPNMQYPVGYNLPAIVGELGLTGKVLMPKYDPILDSWDEVDMAALFATADIYLSASLGEGFGIPVLESMACGVPVIAPDNSSMPELVGDRGWLVKTLQNYYFWPVWVPTNQYYTVPCMKSMLECMEEAYRDENKRKENGRMSKAVAERYNWSRIIPEWETLLKDFYRAFC